MMLNIAASILQNAIQEGTINMIGNLACTIMYALSQSGISLALLRQAE